MKRYRMVGTQQVQLPDGRWLEPGCGEFRAVIPAAREDFLLRIGAIEEVTPEPELEPEVKRRHHGD